MARIDTILSDLCRENDALQREAEYWKKLYYREKMKRLELLKSSFHPSSPSKKEEMKVEEPVISGG